MQIIAENLNEHIELTNKDINKLVKDVNKNPTPKQIECGNYKKAHINLKGFKISIENPKGTYRSGVDKNGTPWKIKMSSHYGYFNTTKGKDGDHIDVYIGPKLKTGKIFVVDQFLDGVFDEHKVMMCYDNIKDAETAYLSNYTKDWKGLKYITEVDIDDFKVWLYSGTKKRKPFKEYKLK